MRVSALPAPKLAVKRGSVAAPADPPARKRARAACSAAAAAGSARASAAAACDAGVPGGTVHALTDDLRAALLGARAPSVLAAWRSITPLARNEFICWASDAKQQATREKRVRRAIEELEEGMRRPCCWPGCKHRERNGR